jgi:hypothetical protein
MKRLLLASLVAVLGAGSLVSPAIADDSQCGQVSQNTPIEPLRYKTEIRPEPEATEVVVEGRSWQRVESNNYEGRRERRNMKRRYRYGTRNDPGRY